MAATDETHTPPADRTLLIDALDYDGSGEVADAIFTLLGSSEQHEAGVLALENNIGVLVSLLEHEDEMLRFQDLYKAIFVFGTDEMQDVLAQAIVTTGVTNLHGGLISVLSDFSYSVYNKEATTTLHETGIGLIKSIYANRHPELDIDDLLASWEVSTSARDLQFVVDQNLRSVERIYAVDKQAIPFLIGTRNVKDFGRYPDALLLSQKEAELRTDLPSVLVVYPREDSPRVASIRDAGAFYRNHQALSGFYASTEGKVYVRLFESESGEMTLQLPHHASAKWGQLVGEALFGHGSSNSIAFGAGKTGSLDRVMLEDSAYAKELPGCFGANPTVIIGACSTARRDWGAPFAQTYSRLLDGKVIATDAATNLFSMDCVKTPDGRITLDAVHTVGSTAFQSGVVVEN
jgi:hypothetical protein